MKKIWIKTAALICAVFLSAAASGCSGDGENPGSQAQSGGSQPNQASQSSQPSEPVKGSRDATPVVLTPEAPGSDLRENETEQGKAAIDVSNCSEGYVIASYTGSNPKVKFQVVYEGNKPYHYDLENGIPAVIPLTQGSGAYTLGVYVNKSGTSYSGLLVETCDVQLSDGFRPFLYPNQYVNFTAESAAVKKGQELSLSANSDLDVITSVYQYVIGNVAYDTEKAQRIQGGEITVYLPVVDETLGTKKGICFDYAALMTAMLRSQRIPTKLVIGYAGELYHSWISVYLEGEGWVDNIIHFDGENWTLMDPTFAAAGDSAKDYVGDGSNYNAVYFY